MNNYSSYLTLSGGFVSDKDVSWLASVAIHKKHRLTETTNVLNGSASPDSLIIRYP